jgi:hypothetical protein
VREIKGDRRATGRAARRQGRRPPKPGSSIEGEVERGARLPPSSPLRTTHSPHWDAVPLQMGAMACEHRAKHPRAKAGLPTGLPSQLLPLQVIFDHEREDDPFVCTSGEKVGLTPSSKI